MQVVFKAIRMILELEPVGADTHAPHPHLDDQRFHPTPSSWECRY